jgi:orotidine-5'-phosphate decarboxylase
MDFSKVIVALDTPDEQKALKLVRALKQKVSTFKVGLELFCSVGPNIINEINGQGCSVFLDLKFHDIPNTVVGAAKAAVRAGAFMFNVHASGGSEMMSGAVKAAEEEYKERFRSCCRHKRPLMLAVTVLTSLDDRDLADVNIVKPAGEQARDLAVLAKKSGMDGVVASPKEVADIRRALGDDFVIVTPGVRPAWAASDDQKRIMTPTDAVDAGADYIVIGRPVTGAADPLLALERIFDDNI